VFTRVTEGSTKLSVKLGLYYTNFSYVDAEWENTLDMILNYYFSTQIDLYPKLDDRLKRTPGEPLLQMQELLSFGLTYRWR
jgi:hypothetical protein